MTTGAETVEFLARTHTRVRILDVLRDADGMTRNEFRERLDASRTTIQRNLETLTDRGILRQPGREYVLTAHGTHLATEFLTLLDTAATIERFQPFLRCLDGNAADFDMDALEDAELFTPEDGDPYNMINRHIELLGQTDEGTAVLPLTGLHAAETARDRVIESGAQFEVVAAPAAVDTYQSAPQYQELSQELVDASGWELYEYEGTLPCGICVFDGTVQLLVAEDGQPRAMVESTNEKLRQWAEAKHEHYREQATRVM